MIKQIVPTLLAIFFSLTLILNSSCSKSSKTDRINEDTHELEVDSAATKYVDGILQDFLKEERNLSIQPINKKGEIEGRSRQRFLHEYFLDNQALSKDSFKIVMSNMSIEHVTRDIKSSRHDSIQGRASKQVNHDIIFSLNAYSSTFIKERMFKVDYAELHFSDSNVLYLSLSTPQTGNMNTVLYDVDTGEKITTYHANAFDGNYYIGNGIVKDIFDGIDNLNNTKRIRAVIMIDDQFCIKEFDVKDITD